jgi:hypothetical protein
MSTAPIERRATHEEWSALLTRLRSKNPPLGVFRSSYTEGDLTLLRPADYVEHTTRSLHAPNGAPGSIPAAEPIDKPDLARLALDGRVRGQAVHSGITTKNGQITPAASDDLAALLLSAVGAEQE